MLPVPVCTATLLNTDYKLHTHNYFTDHTTTEKQFNIRAIRQPGWEKHSRRDKQLEQHLLPRHHTHCKIKTLLPASANVLRVIKKKISSKNCRTKLVGTWGPQASLSPGSWGGEGLLQGAGMPWHQGRGILKQASNPYLDGQEETRSSSCPGKNGRDRQEWAANSRPPQPSNPYKIYTHIYYCQQRV